MKLNTFISALAIAAFAGSAVAQDKATPLTIAAGMPGGGYDKFAKSMVVRLNQRGYSNVSITNNNGSDAITLAACNGKADIWIAQVDAIYTRAMEGCNIKPVADYGVEFAMLLVPPNSGIYHLYDIKPTDTVATDGIGSGTELFWKTIVAIENGDKGSKDAWAKANVVESSPELLNTMANFGDIQAAVLVRKTDSADVKMLLQQGWHIVELWDKNIDDLQFNNKPLYTSTNSHEIRTPQGTVYPWGYDVRAFVGVSKALGEDRSFKMDLAAALQ